MAAELFESRRLPVDIRQPVPTLEITLGLGRMGSEITMTAERGMVDDIQQAPPG